MRKILWALPLPLFLPSVYAIADNTGKDYFDLSIEELLQVDISVASNVSSKAQKQPASVTTIARYQIQSSTARTLNELLSIYVPGYFLVEDQDDTIAGFRGLVPDNNSKTMLLLNGVNINTEWFWGASDALLNGMDLDFIERIEIIRGPGSVTLGQGALLGVVNIITTHDNNASSIKYKLGKNQYQANSLTVSAPIGRFQFWGYLSNGQHDGAIMNNQGWIESREEQGLSIYQRNHRLKSADYQNYFTRLSSEQLSIDLFHVEQKRDLYNFYRDRESVKQEIDGMMLHYQIALDSDKSIQTQYALIKDQYALFSHGGNAAVTGRALYELSGTPFQSITQQLPSLANNIVEPGVVMGGTKERHQNVKVMLNWQNPLPKTDLALVLNLITMNLV
jgi:outer membrane receptor for ferrienterochelin and colicin